MTDFRALCAELYAAFDTYAVDEADPEMLARAKAALAQPEPQGLSDEELLKLMPESMRDDFSYAARVCSDAVGGRVKPGIFQAALNTVVLEYALAVLDRRGQDQQNGEES